MLRKRACRGVVALVLALGLFAATGVQAAEGSPSQGLSGFWTTIETWFQDLVTDLFGVAPAVVPSTTEVPPPDDSGSVPLGPGTQDGGSGDGSTTDTGPGSDPDG